MLGAEIEQGLFFRGAVCYRLILNMTSAGEEEPAMGKTVRGRVAQVVAGAPLLFALACGGCAYNYTFKTGLPASGQRVSETEHQALFGWVSDNVYDLDKACPNGVSEFGSYISFVNWLPSFLTIGLYTPRTAYAVCSEGGAK